jgi:hypothetical protein
LISNRGKRYDPQVVDAFVALQAERHSSKVTEVAMKSLQLKPGMVLARDLTHRDGYLLLAKGCSITREIIGQLARLESSEQKTYTVHVRQEAA